MIYHNFVIISFCERFVIFLLYDKSRNGGITMEHIIVKTSALTKHYKAGARTVIALDGVDLEVKEREFVSIIGKSGCGKSTLLHMIGGLDSPTSGTVVVDGRNLCEMNPEQLALFRRRKAGFVFQQYNLIPDLNIYDNIVFPLELDGAQIDREFVQELLETLYIADKAEMFPSMLSGGEQQRAAIARALAAKPAILLADEPTGNLDTSASHDVIGLLKVIAGKYQQTLIVITHDPDIAQMADRTVRLQDGKILTVSQNMCLSGTADENMEIKGRRNRLAGQSAVWKEGDFHVGKS